MIVGIEVDEELGMGRGSKGELVREMVGRVKMKMMVEYE